MTITKLKHSKEGRGYGLNKIGKSVSETEVFITTSVRMNHRTHSEACRHLYTVQGIYSEIIRSQHIGLQTCGLYAVRAVPLLEVIALTRYQHHRYASPPPANVDLYRYRGKYNVNKSDAAILGFLTLTQRGQL